MLSYFILHKMESSLLRLNLNKGKATDNYDSVQLSGKL